MRPQPAHCIKTDDWNPLWQCDPGFINFFTSKQNLGNKTGAGDQIEGVAIFTETRGTVEQTDTNDRDIIIQHVQY